MRYGGGIEPKKKRQNCRRKARRNQIKFMATKRLSLRSELPGLLILKLMFQLLAEEHRRSRKKWYWPIP